MNEHTKEPWAIELKNVEFADTGDYDGLIQIKAHGDKKPIIEIWNGDDLAEANARRIVACINACAGIDTEKLESKNRAGAITTLVEELVASEKQRDELLAALKEASEEYKKLPHSLGYPLTHCNKWDELIAKVESEK